MFRSDKNVCSFGDETIVSSNIKPFSCFFIRMLCVFRIAIWFRFGRAGHCVVTSFSFIVLYVLYVLHILNHFTESAEWWMIKFDLVKILAIDIVANNMDLLWEMNGFIPRLNLHIFSIFEYCFPMLLQYQILTVCRHHWMLICFTSLKLWMCVSWVLCRAFVCFIIFLLRL